MTRRRQKTEEALFAERAIALLGENWTVQESMNEREWPDILVSTAGGIFGLEVRKLYADEGATGSEKRRAESHRTELLNQVASLYYASCTPPIRVKFSGCPDDPAAIARALVIHVSTLGIWEEKRVSFNDHRWMYLCRLPPNLKQYRRWEVVSDAVGYVDIIDTQVVQRAISEKSGKLARYKAHVKDVRLLLVCDRTQNSGKLHFGDLQELECNGFNYIYFLSFPDELIQVPAQLGAETTVNAASRFRTV